MAVAPLASRWIERLLATQDSPLTVAQFLALRALAREQVTAAELARRTGVSGAAVSQLLAQLEDAGLVKRETVAGDRRRRTLTLSRAGRKAFESADALLRERFGSLLAGPAAAARRTRSAGLFPRSRRRSPAHRPRAGRLHRRPPTPARSS